MPNCRTCGQSFTDYKELALHISIKGTRCYRRSKWAATYLAVGGLSAKNRYPQHGERIPLTEEQKEARRELREYRLSGETDCVDTICPQCKHRQKRYLEIEYTRSEYAYRINGILVRMCQACEGR